MFWKAYEYSAYRFVFGIMKCKAKKQTFKGLDKEMAHIGFPESSLAVHQDRYRLVKKEDDYCEIEPIDVLPNMPFDTWKASIELFSAKKKTVSNSLTNEELIVSKLRNFNLESKTPMDCMMFLVELKKEMNGEV